MNGIGLEAGNDSFTDGRDLPWLQDVAGVDVWDSWTVTYRDVIVLDADNVVVDVYNLTDNDLADPVAYQAMSELLTGP